MQSYGLKISSSWIYLKHEKKIIALQFYYRLRLKLWLKLRLVTIRIYISIRNKFLLHFSEMKILLYVKKWISMQVLR